MAVAEIFADEPLQIVVVLGVTLTLIIAGSVTTKLDDAVQPPLSTTVTMYCPAVMPLRV